MSSPFAELAARSNFSFLEGSASPRDLVAVAAQLGIAGLGLCDRNGLYGAVAFIQAAGKAGIRPVVGTELDLVEGGRLRLLARSRTGYRQLSRAISAAQLAGVKGQPRLRLAGLIDDLGTTPAATPTPTAESAGQRRHPRRQPTLPPPSRPSALRTTAGPFPEGWPSLPSTTPLAETPPAVVDPAELDDCIALAGGPDSAIVAALIVGDRRRALRLAQRLRECFAGDRAALLITNHLHPADHWLSAEIAALGRRVGLPLVASNTPAHATVADKPLLDVLTAIRHRTTLDQAAAHGLLLPNCEHRLLRGATLRQRLAEFPAAFDHAAQLAAQCRLELDFTDVRFPGFPVPEGETPFSVLYTLCQEAVQRKYRPLTPSVARRLQRELDVIEKTNLAEFFLIVHDIMRWAREHGVPGQGRGSAADSVVAYLLDVTRVDPIAHDLLFERFLHEDHQGTPDIDIDFSTDHREQVIQHVYEKYGADRTGMVANVVTFRSRLAVREVGKAMGFPQTIIDRLAKSVDGWHEGGVDAALEVAGLQRHADTKALPWQQFLDVIGQIEGTPRHLSIHVGGMLVTGEPLIDVAPVEHATMEGRVVVQFNKDDVEDLGLIKMDLLGLRTLSAVAETLAMVERTHGDRPDLDRLRLDDPRVYDMICAPDTIGLFQIESRAQQQSLYQSQPREFNDLIVQVAIIRPGPIQGDAVHPYLRRRQGLEPVTYPHPSLEPILAETKGVILYQEQILRIVMEIAGYTAGEADRFRRAMNRHRSRLEMQSLRDEFIQRCLEHGGLALDTAEQIFKSVAGFAQFGFCKSHAAAFARTAYETAWLRLEYPAHWLCALLNAQPMGFYHPSVLVEDAKRHGIRTLPVDVSRSRARCDVERADPADPALTDSERSAERAVHAACRELAGPHRGPRPRSPLLGAAMSEWVVRLGFNYVAGLGPTGRAACDAAVGAGANGSVAEFWRHTKLTRPAMEQLIRCGAFDRACPGRPRRELLWELTAIEEALPPRRRVRAPVQADDRLTTTLPGMPAPPRGRGHVAPPPATAPDPLRPLLELPAPSPQLPAMNERDRVATEYAVNEVSTGPHLIAFLRPALEALGCIPLARVPDCDDGARLRVAGLVIARQAPVSAKGFRFFTLADEGGHLDLVFMPRVALRTRAVANFHPLLMVEGVLQADAGRLNLVVESVTGLDGEGRPVVSRGPSASPEIPGAGNSDSTASGGAWKTPQAHNFR